MKNMGVIFRNVKEKDIPEIAKIIKNGRPYLGLNGNYTYWMLATLYPEYCFVAETKEKEVIGFVTALPVLKKESVFVWQLGVAAEARGQGIGFQLIERVRDYAITQELKGMITSISPKNQASLGTFQKIANKYHMIMEHVSVYKDNEGFLEDVYHIKP